MTYGHPNLAPMCCVPAVNFERKIGVMMDSIIIYTKNTLQTHKHMQAHTHTHPHSLYIRDSTSC